MPFNSLEFILFFPLAAAIYLILPPRLRWLRQTFLLLASIVFCLAGGWQHLLSLAGAALFTWLAAFQMQKAGQEKTRRAWMLLSLIGNIALLLTFKYLNFFGASLNGILIWLGISSRFPALEILLPLGISFYTFQNLSYTLDVYHRVTPAEPNFWNYALYVSFFPKLVSGPIERARDWLPQLRQPSGFDYQLAADGLKRMAWGFFKKLVIADRLAPLVVRVFDHPGNVHGPGILIATYFFAFQIYIDFSAYSDIAIGAAGVLGFRLSENFQRPYFATSVIEFWNRWHITLSHWLRDYIFYPLRRSLLRRRSASLVSLIVPPMLTLLVSGLWHGAGWTFILWGALHGLYYVLAIALKGWGDRILSILRLQRFEFLSRALKAFFTFNLVSFAWIFFRAGSLNDAFTLVHNLFQKNIGLRTMLRPYDRNDLPVLLLVLILVLLELLQERFGLRPLLNRLPVAVRWGLYYLLVMGIILFGSYSFAPQAFTYAQF